MLAKNGDITSVQFSRSVVSDSLRPHGQQHARPPCPSPTPRVRLNPCPSSRWCHPTISSSVVPFSSCPQSFPASGSSPTRKLFASGGQRIGASASASVLAVSTQDWSPLNIYPWMAHTPGFIFPIFNRTSFFLLSDDKWWCVVFFVMRLFPSSPISDFAQEKLLNMSHSLGHELPRIWTHGSPFSLLQRKTLNHHCILDWECQASSWTP